MIEGVNVMRRIGVNLTKFVRSRNVCAEELRRWKYGPKSRDGSIRQEGIGKNFPELPGGSDVEGSFQLTKRYIDELKQYVKEQSDIVNDTAEEEESVDNEMTNQILAFSLYGSDTERDFVLPKKLINKFGYKEQNRVINDTEEEEEGDIDDEMTNQMLALNYLKILLKKIEDHHEKLKECIKSSIDKQIKGIESYIVYKDLVYEGNEAIPDFTNNVIEILFGWIDQIREGANEDVKSHLEKRCEIILMNGDITDQDLEGSEHAPFGQINWNDSNRKDKALSKAVGAGSVKLVDYLIKNFGYDSKVWESLYTSDEYKSSSAEVSDFLKEKGDSCSWNKEALTNKAIYHHYGKGDYQGCIGLLEGVGEQSDLVNYCLALSYQYTGDREKARKFFIELNKDGCRFQDQAQKHLNELNNYKDFKIVRGDWKQKIQSSNLKEAEKLEKVVKLIKGDGDKDKKEIEQEFLTYRYFDLKQKNPKVAKYLQFKTVIDKLSEVDKQKYIEDIIGTDPEEDTSTFASNCDNLFEIMQECQGSLKMMGISPEQLINDSESIS